jgi:hypothetical protein
MLSGALKGENNTKGCLMSEEKRRFTRIPFKVTGELTVHGVTYISPEISNLSVGGCLLPIAADLEPGIQCQVKIILSGTSSELSVNVSGEVMRCQPPSVAIKFTHIDLDSLYHLQNIIRYNANDVEKIEKEIEEHPGLV